MRVTTEEDGEDSAPNTVQRNYNVMSTQNSRNNAEVEQRKTINQLSKKCSTLEQYCKELMSTNQELEKEYKHLAEKMQTIYAQGSDQLVAGQQMMMWPQQQNDQMQNFQQVMQMPFQQMN